jgi:trans-L-3-hydroxyproline dehydratase
MGLDDAMREWRPPADWPSITVIDAHTAGEPLRVITGGVPAIPGLTILEKRRYAVEHLDQLRRVLVFEPRGHADMYGCVLTEPASPDGDFGVLFFHNEGFSTMCGHGVIGLATVLVETGAFPSSGPEVVMRMDTPAGRVTARAAVAAGRVESVALENVPSFVDILDRVVDVPGVGSVRCDIAFGGAYYAYCRADELGVRVDPTAYQRLIDIGTAIKRAVAADVAIRHPTDPDLGFLYGTIIDDAPRTPGADLRNVCIFADGEVDRSPTGTGVSGRLAIEHARGRLAAGQPFVVESLIGTRFEGRVLRADRVAGRPAIVPEIRGSAHIVARSEMIVAPDDPLRDGFLLR